MFIINKKVLFIVIVLICVNCFNFMKTVQTNSEDAISNQLRNQFCTNEFTIKFKVLSNVKIINYQKLKLYSIDIEILKIYKGLYNDSNSKYNYATKLYSQIIDNDEDDNQGNLDELNQCSFDNQLNSLIINQIYLLIGNFNQGRLHLNKCDILKKIEELPSKFFNYLEKDLKC